MANPLGNINLGMLDLPAEVRVMIWDLVVENNQLWVGRYGDQRHNESMIRRLISDEEPAYYGTSYPRHALELVHPTITAEFRERWDAILNSRLTLGEMSCIPIGIFDGITHLSLTMEQAVKHLQAVVPRLPHWRMDPRRPNTPLTLKHGSSIQQLEIRWRTSYDWWYDHEDQDVGVLMARLQYFRRSFSVTVKVEAILGDGVIAMKGSLLDNRSPFLVNRDADRTHDQDVAFLARMAMFTWRPQCLTLPVSDQRRAVLEAHPYYGHVPLGWRSIGFSNFALPNTTAALRVLSRPYDT